jgi:hypothetical protein
MAVKVSSKGRGFPCREKIKGGFMHKDYIDRENVRDGSLRLQRDNLLQEKLKIIDFICRLKDILSREIDLRRCYSGKQKKSP